MKKKMPDVRKLVKHLKTWKPAPRFHVAELTMCPWCFCMTKTINKNICGKCGCMKDREPVYPPVLANSQERGKKPEVKKNCYNCLYQEAYILCDNCTDDDFNWQPKQESELVYYSSCSKVYQEDACDFNCKHKQKTCNRKFRLVPVEGK